MGTDHLENVQKMKDKKYITKYLQTRTRHTTLAHRCILLKNLGPNNVIHPIFHRIQVGCYARSNTKTTSRGGAGHCHVQLSMGKYRIWLLNMVLNKNHNQVGSMTPTRSKDCPWDLLIVMAHASFSGNWRLVNRIAMSPVMPRIINPTPKKKKLINQWKKFSWLDQNSASWCEG